MRREFDDNYDRKYSLDLVDEYVWRAFPRIESEDSQVLEDYMNDKINFCSFDIHLDEDLRKEILIKSLLKASDPKDPAYCKHAAEKHRNFTKTVITLLDTLDNETYILKSEMKVTQTLSPSGTKSKFILTPAETSKPRAVYVDMRSVARDKMDPKMPWTDRENLLWMKYRYYCSSRLASVYTKSKSLSDPF